MRVRPPLRAAAASARARGELEEEVREPWIAVIQEREVIAPPSRTQDRQMVTRSSCAEPTS